LINPDLFLAYVLAAAALIILPGPIVSLVIAQSLAHGKRTGLTVVLGAQGGTAILIAIGAIGLTTLLTHLADVFEYVRWAGVAWLVYLGAKHWRAALRAAGDQSIQIEAGRSVFWQGFLVGATNPKTVLFYAAFFPQFLDPALAAAPQLALMSIAFLAIALMLDGAYALLAGQIRGLLAGRRQVRIRNGITGTLLMGTGIGLALMRR